MRRAVLAAALAVLVGACGREAVPLADLLGKEPPPLRTGGVAWVGSEPLTLASLRGKVVYLEFGFEG